MYSALNFNEPLREFRFDTKENACLFRDAIKAKISRPRILKISVKKSLPEYKGEWTDDWSVFVMFHSFGAFVEAKDIIGNAPGRKVKTPYITLHPKGENANV